MTSTQLNIQLKILYLNVQGQTKMTLDKQMQINDFIEYHKFDIVHFQEIDFNDDTFQSCHFILNNYNIITNNSATTYGTASMIKTRLHVMQYLPACRVRLSLQGLKRELLCWSPAKLVVEQMRLWICWWWLEHYNKQWWCNQSATIKAITNAKPSCEE